MHHDNRIDSGDKEERLIIEPSDFQRVVLQKRPLLQFRPLAIALLTLFSILSLLVWFMFSASVVKLSITPFPEEMEIIEGFPTYQLGERLLMIPGQYQIEARLKGYELLKEDFEVTAIDEQELQFSLQKLPGRLSVTTNPTSNATVKIDGITIGSIPLADYEVSPGKHLISVHPERYLIAEQSLVIEGMEIQQEISFALEPAWALVSITSQPEGADIFIDDIHKGNTPATIEVLKGVHQLNLKLDRYKSFRNEFSVEAGNDLAIGPISLIKADGSLLIATTPPGASISLSEEYIGQSPVSVRLKPGTPYHVAIRKAGYVSEKRKITLAPEEDIEMDVKLKAIRVQLDLIALPEGARLFVNGQDYGLTPDSVELLASKHLLRFEKAGYQPEERWITLHSGLRQKVEITLKTLEQAAFDAIPKELTTSLNQKLRLIVPGKITLGAARSEPGRRSNEVIRETQLERLFYLGTKEVTNKEFSQFDSRHDSGTFGRSVLSLDDRPVVNVSWDQAVEFCNWLSKREGLPEAYIKEGKEWVLLKPFNAGYRLPTEAEWAWSARRSADSGHPFPWGREISPPAGAGNFADLSAQNLFPRVLTSYNDGYRGSAPAGSFRANDLGIYDLAGNVSEWTNDRYGVIPRREAVIDPDGPATGKYHVIRGSSFAHGSFSELRWVYRDFGNKPRPDVGFRLARYVE